MRAWHIIVGGLAVFFFHTGSYWSATWLSKWALILVLFGLATSVGAAKKTSFLYLPLMLYVFLSLIALSVWPQSPYQNLLDPVTLLALQKNALYGLMIWTISLSALAAFTVECVGGASWVLACIWSIGTLSTLWLPSHGMLSPPNNGMWFGNPSMGASLLAICLPFVWMGYSHLKWYATVGLAPLTWLLTLLAIYRTGASVPWGVLGIVSAAFLVSWSVKKWRTLIPIAALAVMMVLLGHHLLGKDFWDQNGRFEIWRMGWDWFRAHTPIALGAGFSSSQIMLPIEQVLTNHYHGEYFLWLHNDWLQLAIEGGYVGMACVFLALFRLVRVSFRYPSLFAGLMGFCALALFNYPLRMPIHSMCLLLIAASAEALTRFAEVPSRKPARVPARSYSVPA